MSKKTILITIIALVMVMIIFVPVLALDGVGLNSNTGIDLSPIINQIIEDYGNLYELDNFDFETFPFKVGTKDYIGINIFVDMTLIKHPSELEYFKGVQQGINNLNDSNEKANMQAEMDKRIQEIEEECYGVNNRSTFTYAIELSDEMISEYKMQRNKTSIDDFYYRIDAEDIVLYDASTLEKPNNSNNYSEGLLELEKNIFIYRSRGKIPISKMCLYYDRIAARDWARDNAYATPEFPSDTVSGSDCANFVSKAINAGGIPEDRSGDWYRASRWGGWAGNNWVRTGYYNNGGVVPYMVNDGYFYEEGNESKIDAGCIMFWLTNSHVALVTYGDSVTIKYTQHGGIQSRDTVYRPGYERASFYRYY